MPETTPEYLAEADRHRRWRDGRAAELGSPDSWLGVIGLVWLEAGETEVGSGPDCVVRLPSGPERLGVVAVSANGVAWHPADGELRPLATDAAGDPDRVRCGDLEFFVIERDGRLAVRLRDLGWRGRRDFTGIETWPWDPAWRIDACWEALPEPATIAVPTMSGDLKSVTVRHRAVFECDGHAVGLLPMDEGADGVFFVFRDATSGRGTYGGGRFLRAAPAAAGRVILDFNYAYNPPCAFTAFAACPLPPPENWLPVAVNAGERRYAGPH